MSYVTGSVPDSRRVVKGSSRRIMTMQAGSQLDPRISD